MKRNPLQFRRKSSMALPAAILVGGCALLNIVLTAIANWSQEASQFLQYTINATHYTGKYWNSWAAMTLLTVGAAVFVYLMLSKGTSRPKLFAIPVICFAAGFLLGPRTMGVTLIDMQGIFSPFYNACLIISIIAVLAICVLFLLHIFSVIRCKRLLSTLIAVFLGWNLILYIYSLAGSPIESLNYAISVFDMAFLAGILMTVLSLDENAEASASKFDRVIQFTVYALYQAVYCVVFIAYFAFIIDHIYRNAFYSSGMSMREFDMLGKAMLITIGVSFAIALLQQVITILVVLVWDLKNKELRGKRELAAVILLMIFVPGVYYPIWLYGTTKALRNQSDQSAFGEMMLCLLVPYYSIYWAYKYSKRLYGLYIGNGIQTTDFMALHAVLFVFIPVVGVCVFQAKLNKFYQQKELQELYNRYPGWNPGGRMY